MDVWGDRPRPGVWRDSWGGWVVLCVASSAFLYSAVSIMFDGRTQVLTSTGRYASETTGRYGALVAAVSLFAAVAFSALALSGRLLRGRFGAPVTAPLIVLVGWGAVTTWLRGEGTGAVVQAILLLLTVLAVVASPPTRTTLSRLSFLRDVLVVGSFAWSLLNPVTAQTVCRPDKCGLFGTLWYGLFSSENSAGAAVALLLPTLLVAGPRRLRVSLAAALVFIAATGSRTAILSAVVAVLYLTMARRRSSRHAAPPGPLWRLFPVAGLAASLVVFLGGSGPSLTGRGSVYLDLKAALDSGQALLVGAGPEVLTGLLDGFVDSAHGEAPNDLVLFGVPGLLLLVLALLQVSFVRHWSWQQLAALGLLATAAARFPTEAGLMLGLRTPEAVVLLLVCGLFAAAPPAGRGAPRRTTRAARVAGDGGPAVAAARVTAG